MASLCCFKQQEQEQISTQFERCNGECLYMRTAIPYVGYGEVAAGQLGVGQTVKIILPNNYETEFFIVGLRMCRASLGRPLLLLSANADATEYSLVVVLPNVEYGMRGSMTKWYDQVIDRNREAVLTYAERLFLNVRRFKPNHEADIAIGSLREFQ